LPEDLAIVGFNDDPLAQDLDPALTTVTAPKDLIGVLAARRLIERVHAPDLQPIIQLVPTKLVIRRSCGAALGSPMGTSRGQNV
jgi:DNA-binding LacI/PurR family transcriptional regulator